MVGLSRAEVIDTFGVIAVTLNAAVVLVDSGELFFADNADAPGGFAEAIQLPMLPWSGELTAEEIAQQIVDQYPLGITVRSVAVLDVCTAKEAPGESTALLQVRAYDGVLNRVGTWRNRFPSGTKYLVWGPAQRDALTKHAAELGLRW